ncbi:hypothetical protein D3C75_1168900 [compost metagenome]
MDNLVQPAFIPVEKIRFIGYERLLQFAIVINDPPGIFSIQHQTHFIGTALCAEPQHPLKKAVKSLVVFITVGFILKVGQSLPLFIAQVRFQLKRLR